MTCPQGEQGSSVLETSCLWVPGAVLQLWTVLFGGQGVDLKLSLHCPGKAELWT